MATHALVTGGAGFIGAHLVRTLLEHGVRVRVVDDLSVGSARYLEGLACELVVDHLERPGVAERVTDGIDAVVHLAGRAGIPDSVADPIGGFAVNVGATVALLDAARLAGARRFVLASTNAVLGEAVPPMREDALAHPISPYGASKLAGEAYVQAYAASYGMAACAVRFSNAYGGWALHKRSVVAAWVRDALEGRPLVVNGDGSQTRDFVHATDLAAGVLAVLEAPEARVAGEVFQLGSGVETSVAALAALVGDAVGGDVRVVHAPARAGDVARNVSDVAKAARVLGWTPRIRLADGVSDTVAWFRDALADAEMAGIRPAARSGSD
jgi:UDP-glucose 4-epimerase